MAVEGGGGPRRRVEGRRSVEAAEGVGLAAEGGGGRRVLAEEGGRGPRPRRAVEGIGLAEEGRRRAEVVKGRGGRRRAAEGSGGAVGFRQPDGVDSFLRAARP